MTSKSRLYRIQNRRLTRQAVVFFSLTVVLVAILAIFGIPLVVKGAGFLIDLRSASAPAKKTNTTAPPPPQLLTTFEATNSATLSISGFSQPGNEITLFQNSNSAKSLLTDQDGNFTFTDITLETGENRFWTTAKNSEGSESQLSNQIAVTFDNTPPTLEISSPSTGTKLYGPENKTITIQGKTEPNATLYLNDRLVNISQNGDFTYRYTLNEGDNSLHFQATDPAGNLTSTDVTLSFAP